MVLYLAPQGANESLQTINNTVSDAREDWLEGSGHM